ncbi:hypothetical protein GCM10010170_049880 [Dactylosporangium salmoneum]|uniref:histidine kinase n=2 Tax=Dactylosporangium salmoneum TaxID=53361 RepID=A0ABP5TPT5_9ACTN
MLMSDEAADADIGVNAAGDISEWPARAAELFGYERSRALGASFAGLLLPPRLQGTALPCGIELDVPIVHRDGHELHAALLLKDGAIAFRPLPHRCPPDAELYLRATADPDLPERHRLLTELSQLRTEFIRVASHELRTPLTSIVTFATMLESGDDAIAMSPQDRRAALSVIRRNAEHMQVLVADLLLLTRLETAEAPLDLAPLHLSELLDFPGVPLQLGPGPQPLGDRHLLRELFHTAVEIGRIVGPPRIEAAYGNGRWTVVVSVATEGGLTAERLLSMRIPHPEKAEEYRTGALALMLGREIAARHGGTMLTSVDRPGVTVRVSFPGVAT